MSTSKPIFPAPDRMKKLVALLKTRGFVFPTAEIYDGMKSSYDLGPLGDALARNLKNLWLRDVVTRRRDVVTLSSSVLTPTPVLKASGHIDGFADPLVDCKICRERFRADKAPRGEPGAPATILAPDERAAALAVEILTASGAEPIRDGLLVLGDRVCPRGYVCPRCGSGTLSEERQFNLMFRTFMGSVDPIGVMANALEEGRFRGLSGRELRAAMDATLAPYTVYLRPETAQGQFSQYLNIQRSMSMKIPFGIAQVGRSYRNEITVEHHMFRSVEFEQMELEFFVEPGSDANWAEYWRAERMAWWRRYANHADDFRLREHAADELAHYARSCADIEYRYPWGWGELEGIANRGDFDLKQHTEHSGVRLDYTDPRTGKRYVPYVIEPAAGATRGVLVYLLDALHEDEVPSGDTSATRTVLRLHPLLAPVKAAVLPLVKKSGLIERAERIQQALLHRGLAANLQVNDSIGRRYRREDEIGTPYCVTVDHQTAEDGSVTIRDRDSLQQRRLTVDGVIAFIEETCRG